MSVIIRLQNLPWSANALDIRNYFRGLSIPEGGVHIVGGELGDAFIAFSTDEDARQAMMLDCGKIKEIQVKLLLSSRSEMHKVIEAARQTVPILSLPPAPAPAPVALPAPLLQPAPASNSPFSSVISSGGIAGFGIPGLGNPQEIPQPAVIEPPQLLISPQSKTPDEEENDDKSETKRTKDRRRSRSRSRSRERERKDRKRDRRDRSRSRERRRRDRSRSRDRRDRKRDRKDRSRSRERSPRRSRDKRRSPQSSQERSNDKTNDGMPQANLPGFPNAMNQMLGNGQMGMQLNQPLLNGPQTGRFADPTLKEAFNKLQELGKKRNPNAFQGDQNNTGGRSAAARGGHNNNARGGANTRRDGRQSRFEDQPRDCCVAIRNAPNHTSYGDVRRFFPFMIDKHGIKMINDNMGRRTGNIFVRFCEPRSKQLALQKPTNELKGAIVNVETLEDDLYDAATDSYLPYRDDNEDQEQTVNTDQDNRRPTFTFSVLKLADLPHFVKELDIVKAFNDFSLLSILLNDCRLTRTKVAYVQFANPDDARTALERKESYLFGRRQPVITPVTDDEYENEKKTDEKIETQNNHAANDEQVPEPAVPRDPRQRRQNDNGPGPMQQQHFVPNGPFQQNFNPGFPGVQFAGYPAGNIDPRAAAANWASQNMAQQARGPLNNSQVINLDADDEPLDCVLMKGLPSEATDRTILDFLSDTGAVPARIHLMLDSSSRPSGDCFCEFRSSHDARQAATKHGSNLDGNRITVDLVMRSVVEEALEGPKTDIKRDNSMFGNGPALLSNPPMMPQMFDQNFPGRGGFRGRGFQRGTFDRGGFNRGGFDQSRGSFRGRGNWSDRGRGGFDRGRGRGFARGRGGFDRGDTREMRDDDDPALEDFGAPGCVVSMENVPFRASVDDILVFFGNFDLTSDDVIRRYNERGQPTGDARVAFPSPAVAQRAVATCNMNQIFDRRVSLTLL